MSLSFQRPLSRFGAAVSAGSLTLLAVGCASYPDRLGPAVAAFERGDLDTALSDFADRDATKSRFLSGVEAGTVALAQGDWQAAVDYLGPAAEISARYADASALSAGNALESIGTLLYNDTAATYEGEGFERVYAHSSLALAYLALGRLDDARVETRLANRLLENEEELYDADYRAGGLGHFLSAVTYLLEGDRDDALIDYMRMIDKRSGTALAGAEATRLALELGRDDLLSQLRDFAPTPVATANPSQSAWIVVVAGVGIAPRKVQQTIAFPTPSGIVQLVSPQYVNRPQSLNRIGLRVDGERYDASVVESVARVARENLEDRLGAAALRSAARNAGRLAARKQFTDDDNYAAAAAIDFWTLATERADLRSWLTLPDSWQAAMISVQPGAHDLSLSADGRAETSIGTYELGPAEFMIVYVRTAGARVHVHPIGGQRQSAPASP